MVIDICGPLRPLAIGEITLDGTTQPGPHLIRREAKCALTIAVALNEIARPCFSLRPLRTLQRQRTRPHEIPSMPYETTNGLSAPDPRRKTVGIGATLLPFAPLP